MTSFKRQDIALDRWSFRREDGAWAQVTLPHSAVCTDADGGGHWQGVCEYRRTLQVPDPKRGERLSLYFHAAMHTAEVLVDGVMLATHSGGYLPFEVDVSAILADGRTHDLSVRLDNRDAPEVPPGKPLAELDFCWYGGLYRGVELRRRAPLHISDAATAGVPMGGGVFVRTVRADAERADILATVHVVNTLAKSRRVVLLVEVISPDSSLVCRGKVRSETVQADSGGIYTLGISLPHPDLWSTETPSLYSLRVTLCDAEGRAMDSVSERFGIRTLSISRSGGLVLNGRRIRPRGTNRHQDHPYAGYALPAAAQRRDAVRIKEAGFDYVRLSHYPQSPAFLEACDELGILVMNCIPGWQYIGGEKFREASLDAARAMIRRDRNHPCVILWELSLNETDMPVGFTDAMQQVRREELPAEGYYSCGWMDAYDVYIRARQHGLIHTWANGDKALVVSEYGDWEYYAENEGFDQKSGRGLLPAESNSRALPCDGDVKLLRQAANFAEALEDTLSSPAVLCGQWLMFDYPRGYEPRRASCGVMDFFRIPKFAYHFYRSQRDASEGGSMVFIACRTLDGVVRDLTVFTNAQNVVLWQDGRVVGTASPDRARFPHLPHPPVVFCAVKCGPGDLVAEAVEDGRVVASHTLRTPGQPAALRLSLDTCGVSLAEDADDVVFARVEVVDGAGNVCTGAGVPVTLRTEGGAAVVGPDCAKAEAGVASFVLRVEAGEAFSLTASAEGFQPVVASY